MLLRLETHRYWYKSGDLYQRIYADFYPAFGVIAAATNDTNFHKFKEQTPFARKRVNMNEVNVHL